MCFCCTDPISLKGIQQYRDECERKVGCTDPISLKGIQREGSCFVGSHCCTDPISLKGIQPTYGLDSESSIRNNFKDLCRNICSTFCTSKTVFT